MKILSVIFSLFLKKKKPLMAHKLYTLLFFDVEPVSIKFVTIRWN